MAVWRQDLWSENLSGVDWKNIKAGKPTKFGPSKGDTAYGQAGDRKARETRKRKMEAEAAATEEKKGKGKRAQR